MLESYAVGVNLTMTSNTSVLDKLIKDMEALDKLGKGVRDTFGSLAKELSALSSAGRSVSNLARAMEKLGGSTSAVSGFEKMASAAANMTSQAERLTGILRENAALAAETARSMNSAGGRGPGGGGRAGGGSRGGGGHDLMLTGIGASIAGHALTRGTESMLDRSFAMGHLRTLLLSDRRVTAAQADAAVGAAYSATNSAPGSRVTDNMGSLVDLKNVTGSLDEAQAILPQFSQLSTLLQLVDRKKGGSGDPAFAAAKAMDIMGQMISEHVDAGGHTIREIDVGELQKHMAAMTRVAVATNGRVGPSDYLGFAKQSRVAGMTLSDEFIYEKLPSLILALGGSRTGTALMSMAQVYRGGKLTDKSYDALHDIGLAGASTTVRDPKTGKMVRKNPGIYDADLMASDPLAWMEKAQGRMDAAGIHGTKAQVDALMKASQRATIAGIFADLLKDMPAILKEQTNIQNTKSDPFKHFSENDPAAKVQQMQAAFDKLLLTLGSASMDDAVKVMDRVASGLNAISEWALKNPDTARMAVDTAAGLGAIATALGALSTAIFLFGPALRLLGVGGAAVATGATVAGVGGAAAGGPLAAVLAGIILPAVVGSAYETPQTNSQIDKLRRDRGTGLMPDAPNDGYGGGSNPIRVHITNGRDLARGTSDYLGHQADLPNAGPSRFDGRMGRAYPSNAGSP